VKKFEFMYGDAWYKYDSHMDGYIYRKTASENYVLYCPVARELTERIDEFDLSQCRIIMTAVVHGYVHGKLTGANDKVREIKRVLDVD
jgi:hypothetical protein